MATIEEIEEKAKAYDEAVKKLKVLHDDWATTQNRAAKEVEEIFPELAEGERIRKALIKYYSFDKDGGSHALNNITPKQIVAWLEKQCEQKPAWSEEDLCKIEYALFGTYAVDVATRLSNKIKSLKPQNTWKPSDEQMGVIEAVINNRSFLRRHLDSLYEQLKKLREV